MTPVGPNLSHWPGNRTPAAWRADLSTGIALRFARADAAAQASFLGDANVVCNDHYDTDGFGSLVAILRPEVAFPREEVLLAAAATGDFGTWQTWRGFAIDRTVARLATAASPVAGAFHGVTDPDELTLCRYAWLLEHAESVLDQVGQFRALYADEMATVQDQIHAGLGGAIEHQPWPELGFAVLTTRGDRHRMALNTLAGAYRVLHVRRDADGVRYRYHDRTESWFELVTIRPPLRRDLRSLAARLAALEPPRDGAAWTADSPTEPIPELYFGVPSRQEYGQLTRELRPSALRPEQVIAACVAHFAAPLPG
jgi:hypothetical protein